MTSFHGHAPHDDIFSSSSIPAYISQASQDTFELPVQWVTSGQPPFPEHDMSKIYHLVTKVYAEKYATDELVDISDIKSVSLEEIRKNSRIDEPDSKANTAWVFYRPPSSAAAEKPRKVSNPWTEWSAERRVSCSHSPFSGDKPQDFSIDDLGGRVNLNFLLKLECTRSETETRAKLTIPQMDFGMKTTCHSCPSKDEFCERKHGQFLVKKFRVIVSPNDWAKHCGELRPCATSTVFQLQSSSGMSVQIPLFNPKLASFTLQASKGVTHSAPSFGWNPASREEFSGNAVDWTWELKRATDGTTIDYKTRLDSKSLGINPSFVQVLESVSATWHGLPNVDLEELHQNWSMTIVVQTATIRENPLLGHSKVYRGPTLAFSQDGLSFQ